MVYDPVFKYGQNFYLVLTEEAKERILNVSDQYNLNTGYVCSSFVADLGPVVRRPIGANPGLDFIADFFFFLSKAFSRTIFSILFSVSNHQIVDKKNSAEFDF